MTNAWRARCAHGIVAGLLIACVGCPADEEPTDDDGAGSTSADTAEASTASGGTPTASDGETDLPSTTDAPVEIPWSDVPCGEGTCTGTEVCVQPGIDCDFSPCDRGGEAVWIEEPPACQPFLEECDPLDPLNCLANAHCGFAEFNSFTDGFLECGPVALDCYCP